METLKQILFVGLGGGLGSIIRYLVSALTTRYNSSIFPLATFTVNILGCLFIGLLIGWVGQNIEANQNLKLLLITGFCGGYTTFSAFASENLTLIQNQYYGTAIAYSLGSMLLGVLAVWLGLFIGK